jgi:hypothetical protein
VCRERLVSGAGPKKAFVVRNSAAVQCDWRLAGWRSDMSFYTLSRRTASQTDVYDNEALARLTTLVDEHPIIKKLQEILPVDKYVGLSMISTLLNDDVPETLKTRGLVDSMGRNKIHIHFHNKKRYLCFSGSNLLPPLNRGVKFNDCIATEHELFPRGRERDELLARLRRGAPRHDNNNNNMRIKIITRDKHELQGVVAKRLVTRCSLTTSTLNFL